MSLLVDRLDQCIARRERAMGLFLTSGFPTMSATLPILEAFAESADFIELGMPFSDPIAEGPPIQRSSTQALRNGANMQSTLDIARTFRSRHNMPLVLMGYINPILRFGVENFCDAAQDAGVCGLIVPDLPPEEALILSRPAAHAGLDLIYLVAPNTPQQRVQEIDEHSSGFVYAVSVTGVTGAGLDRRRQGVESYLRQIRPLVRQNPLLVGFGIKSHADADRLCRHTDGFIVGSALVEQIEALWSDTTLSEEARVEAIASSAKRLKHGPGSPPGTVIAA